MTKPKITYAVEWIRHDGTWGRYRSILESEAEARKKYDWLTRAYQNSCDHRIVQITLTERVLPNKVRATPQQAKEGFQKMREAAK